MNMIMFLIMFLFISLYDFNLIGILASASLYGIST